MNQYQRDLLTFGLAFLGTCLVFLFLCFVIATSFVYARRQARKIEREMLDNGEV